MVPARGRALKGSAARSSSWGGEQHDWKASRNKISQIKALCKALDSYIDLGLKNVAEGGSLADEANLLSKGFTCRQFRSKAAPIPVSIEILHFIMPGEGT